MGFRNFFKSIGNLFKREHKEVIEEHSMVRFPRTEYPYLQQHSAPSSHLESSVIPAPEIRQIPQPPPKITIIPPSISYRGELRQEDLESHQRYAPEVRIQVDDFLGTDSDPEEPPSFDFDHGDDVPSTPVPPYTKFASTNPHGAVTELVHTPRSGAGANCQMNYRDAQFYALIPVVHHSENLHHPSYPDHRHLHHGPPPPRGPRSSHSREQATRLHSPEAPRRRSRNTPADSNHPLRNGSR